MNHNRRVAIAALLLAVAACTTTRTASVKVSPVVLPPPLYQPLPLDVAVWYTPELAQHRAQGTRTVSRPNGDSLVTHYVIDGGSVHRDMIRSLFASAFRRVVELPSQPDAPLADPSLALILLPRVERISYGAGADARYLIDVRTPDGERLTSFLVAGVADENLGEARWLAVAIRDAAAQILVRLARDDNIAALIAARRADVRPLAERPS